MDCNSAMREYHRAQVGVFHNLAQTARKEKIRLASQRKHLEALKAEMRWKEYCRTRDYHKGKAKEFA